MTWLFGDDKKKTRLALENSVFLMFADVAVYWEDLKNRKDQKLFWVERRHA